MKILSIDTSSKICGVAVLENAILLKEILQDNGLTHSESLMPIIKNILSELNLDLSNIDLIVCDKGPGSFTGIRIGVATTMAFADSLNIKTIGISSLEALAYNVKTDGIICSLIDAKNDNVYVGLFEKSGETYKSRRKFSTENISNILLELQNINNGITFVGDGAVTHKNKIISMLPNSKFIETNELSAYKLGLAGLAHLKDEDLQDILPLYLRKPQAERLLEKEAKDGDWAIYI